MLYFLCAIAAVVVGLWALGRFKNANIPRLARQLRGFGGWSLVGLGVIATLRGGISYGIPLIMLGAGLLKGGGLLRDLGGARRPTAGRTSRVLTDHLEMSLDLDTGAMTGKVLKGVFTGRAIETLAPAELALLWRDCRFTDPKSAQLIEAWLDRTHPTWREDMARAEAETGPGGVMTRAEALEILGLAEGASEEEVRRAHRTLMKRMHPDAGGSGYLAAKINEAKDLLLRR